MKPFLIDTNFSQNLVEVGLFSEFMSATENLKLNPVITTTCSQENSLWITNIVNKHIDSGALTVIDDSPYGNFTGTGAGEESIMAIVKDETYSNTWVGTADKSATSKLINLHIPVINHIEFLCIMVNMGLISITKASGIYVRWLPILKKYTEINFPMLHINREKEILAKFGTVALLA